MRLMSQTIGRSIRHSKDYGMVFILEEKITHHYKKLSGWIVNHLISDKNQYEVYSMQDDFFRGEISDKRIYSLQNIVNHEIEGLVLY